MLFVWKNYARGCAPGYLFFRAPKRANTSGLRVPTCGVCLLLRKTVPVCSGNHTREPMHPQDPLSSRISFSKIYLLSPSSMFLFLFLLFCAFSILMSVRPPFFRHAVYFSPSLVSTVAHPLRLRTCNFSHGEPNSAHKLEFVRVEHSPRYTRWRNRSYILLKIIFIQQTYVSFFTVVYQI